MKKIYRMNFGRNILFGVMDILCVVLEMQVSIQAKNILNSKEINPVQFISETKDFRVFLQIYYKNLIYLLTNKKFYGII